MYKVIFKTEGGEDVTVFAAPDKNILDLARESNVFINAPCSGNGTCGKCLVKVQSRGTGTLLACRTLITGDAVVIVPGIESVGTASRGTAPSRDTGTVLAQAGCLSPCLAVDVGTTTVSALLVDLASNTILAENTVGNAQVVYGADVINRIIEQQKPNGIEKLQRSIVEQTLNPLIDSLCSAAGISRDCIKKMTIAANTTMNHLLLGVDANSIRIEPYLPTYLEFEPYDPASIGITLAKDAKMILAPNIGSYVGGDITAGVLAAKTPSGANIWSRPEMTLLIDLGTNGEIVFGNEEFLMACACSAGPAFEGGEISCGMRASNGAIETFAINEDTANKDTAEPAFKVIGDCEPKGICGSGLIDIIAELFRTGVIDGKGRFTEQEGQREDRAPYVIAGNITITETDIDNFIRAKGAIFSGIMSLLSPLGFTPADIDDVLIAGGIGSGINIKNAIRIGLLPDLPEEKFSYIGNSSLNGAYEMLISEEAAEKVKEIANNMTYVDLSSEPDYMNEFIAACFLPHTDETLFPSRG